jgi:hypothetical protein
MRQAIRIVVCSLILMLLLAPAYDAFASASLPQKRVLVLYSEEKGHPAHELTDQGIRAVFRANKLYDVQLYAEYLGTSRFCGPDHARTETDYLRRKYAGLRIDAIITVYPAATECLMREESKVFPGVSIVACEIDRGTAESFDRSLWRPLITGVVTGENITSVLDSALHMRPRTKHMALVAGSSPNEAYSEMVFRKGLEPYAGKIDLIDLTRPPVILLQVTTVTGWKMRR